MTHGKLYRSFIILQEDERGHSSSSDKALSGYAKIEVKNDKCKVTFYVQNVKKDNNKCYMMLVCNKKDMKQLINLGAMNINEQGKSEVTFEFPTSDIAGLGISYDKICGAALCKQVDGKNVFIMAGFTTGEIPKDNWKLYKIINSKLNSAIQGKKPEKKGESKIDVKIKEDVEFKKSKSEHNTKVEKEVEIKIEEKQYSKPKKREEDENYNIEETYNNIQETYNNVEENYNEVEETYSDLEEPYNNEVEEVRDSEEFSNLQRNKFDEYEKEIEEINRVEEELEQEDEIQLRGSVGEFFEGIVDGFDNVRNKFSDVKYCKWYHVPVDNLDVMCNVSNYNKYTTIYYPMINYYPYIKKYGHFMVGFKCNEKGKVNYLVYAIPGLKDKSEQPYGGKSGFVTWVEDPERDANMGYWLMFYDFKNSMVVVPMK